MLKLEIEQVCRPEWPRWIIKDSNERFFTGSTWSGSRSEAMLFANRSLAETERSRLHDDITPQVFQVNVLIEMVSNQHVPIEEVKEYISKQARMEIDGDGEHPCSFATFHTDIDWDSFKT